MNSRPLTYVSAGDTDKPLTPSHLLVRKWLCNLPDHLGHLDDLENGEFSLNSDDLENGEFSLNSTQLTCQLRHLDNVLNHFQSRWRREYLSELRESHSHTARQQPNTKLSNVFVGELGRDCAQWTFASWVIEARQNWDSDEGIWWPDPWCYCQDGKRRWMKGSAELADTTTIPTRNTSARLTLWSRHYREFWREDPELYPDWSWWAN